MWETWAQSLGWEDPLEKGMTIHASILAWRIPWIKEPGRLQSMGLQRAGHNWAAKHSTWCQEVMVPGRMKPGWGGWDKSVGRKDVALSTEAWTGWEKYMGTCVGRNHGSGLLSGNWQKNESIFPGSHNLTVTELGCCSSLKIITCTTVLKHCPCVQGSLQSNSWLQPQFSSITQSCPTLCDPMDCSMPGFPVLHYIPELAQIHVHWVGDAIQPSHPLLSPSSLALNLSQHQGLFQWVSSLHQVAKVLEFQLQHQSFQWIFRTDFL